MVHFALNARYNVHRLMVFRGGKMFQKSIIDRFKGCLLGLAVGDAVGTALEFKPKGSFKPITDMVGGGPFRLKPGEWTDDTSMALCLADSLIECGGFDAHDQMERYCRWHSEGYLSSNGRCFDIGNTVSSALRCYKVHGNPYAGSTDAWSAGNGSLMRLAPIPLFCYQDIDVAESMAAESSKTTHSAPECIDACRLFARQIIRALEGNSKEDVLFSDAGFSGSQKIANIAKGNYRTKYESDIHGTGYVVAALEAALWCFWTTDTFRDAVLKAANLGDDADTTAAICGQIAGAYYGVSETPTDWLDKLVMRREIEDLAVKLYV